MRLFAAVLPPTGAADELDSALAVLHRLPGARKLNWTERDGWHFTLAFLGDVDDGRLPALRDGLAATARRHAPCELRLSGGGRFGDRALWTGAGGQTEQLAELAHSVQAAALTAGVVPAQEHAYTPHLTLARNRGAVALGPYADALGGFRGTPWPADTLALVRRNPAPGPRYETVGTWPLGR
ncbi:RNA 2',3'-cyclic phosphodiesterase [Streptomyces sp. H10-C2]|uniref:RNA 2',3'-cyclic phosphodiesterase n=1 Tax=unclassified Streptomyces TaxID=2593676 RepID=UPI0024BB984C|nr:MULTISPECIES: RNA 2',3'-cyclic phosphodiesterase [unclassified Streptomyces]MDJ0345202.1 RNA 2',3'-cyclic phosphodiesterase [Streptomyces sp. PH10-H1]MDJ0374441.1 RNA 2',3'-cyclic phosphodiesterase [Streptomyces sp. H10-C2]